VVWAVFWLFFAARGCSSPNLSMVLMWVEVKLELGDELDGSGESLMLLFQEEISRWPKFGCRL
jgi:hypothetical protein